MHYKIGDTCVYNEHGFCNSVVHEHDSLIHLFHSSTVPVMKSRVSGQCLYTIHSTWSTKYKHLHYIQTNSTRDNESKESGTRKEREALVRLKLTTDKTH